MHGLKIDCLVSGVTLKAKTAGRATSRILEFTLETEFDEQLAASAGQESIYEGITIGTVEQAKVGILSHYSVDLVSGDGEQTTLQCYGKSIQIKAGGEGDSPVAKILLAMPFGPDTLCYLAERLGDAVVAEFYGRQTELEGVS